jgi:internalin A
MWQLWHDIGTEMQEHFLRMMEKFDLSYRIPDDVKNRSLIVERLSFDEDDRYHTKWDAMEGERDLKIRYELNSNLLAGIPTWFIARAHRFSTKIHWRYGALFQDADGNHLALLKVSPNARMIEIAVRGPSPHNFFTLLRDGFEDTLKRFVGLSYRRVIPCPGHEGEPCEYRFDYDYLVRAIEHKPQILEVQCQQTFQIVSVPEMLFGLHYPSTENLIIRHIDALDTTERKRHKHTRRQIDKLDVAEEARHQAEILELRELRTLAQREFARIYNEHQHYEESQCPYVFSLVPHKPNRIKNLLGEEMKLTLWCQEPGHFHPGDETGGYILVLPNDVLRLFGWFLPRLAGTLKYALPLVGGVAGVASLSDYERNLQTQIELTIRLSDAISNTDFPESDRQTYQEMSEGSTMRALRALLLEKDPKQKWGGLRRVFTPEGNYLWLCKEHAAKYRPGVPQSS